MTLMRVEDNEWYPFWTLEVFKPKYHSTVSVRDISPELLARYTRIMADWKALQKELGDMVDPGETEP